MKTAPDGPRVRVRSLGRDGTVYEDGAVIGVVSRCIEHDSDDDGVCRRCGAITALTRQELEEWHMSDADDHLREAAPDGDPPAAITVWVLGGTLLWLAGIGACTVVARLWTFVEPK